MFESLIVPVDGSVRSARALEVAAALARVTGSRVELFLVAPPSTDVTAEKAWLAEVAAGVDAPVSAIEVVEDDSVVDAIADLQRAHPRSLVVLGTHARTGASELFLGGYAGEVLRFATRPVLLVGPKAEVPASFEAVEVCVDGSDESLAILPAAEAFASRVGGRISVVEVLDPAFAGRPDEANTVESAAARIRRESDLHVEWEVLHGRDVPGAIVDHASRLPASVLAMATHGRTNAKGRLLGSVAVRVAHDAPMPVLVARAR